MNLIDDQYEVIQPLKEGGMGAIYKVRHRLLDEIRVVKVMRPQTSEDPDMRRRFLREAKMAIRVRHPNIGQLYDFQVDEAGTAVMVMEFIDGVTLQEVLRSGPMPSLPFVIEIAVQTLGALSCLHFSGIIHRDVSSDNVMLTRSFDGRPLVKLIDLGIAKDPASDATATMSGAFVGKARYASPEQFRGDRSGALTPATDLYSFGVLLYELLTGRLPFDGWSFGELAAGHVFQAPIAFSVTDPAGRVPSGLREVVLHTLQKDPAKRVATAEALAESLRPFGTAGGFDPLELDQLLNRARPASPPESGRATPAVAPAIGKAPKPNPLAAEIDAIVYAVDTPFLSPVALEILDVTHAYLRAKEPVRVSPGSTAELPVAPPPMPRPSEERRAEPDVPAAPARRPDRSRQRREVEAEEEERRPRDKRRPDRAEARPGRLWMAYVTVGLFLLGIGGYAVWITLRDPFSGQIEAVKRLQTDTETAVNDKLTRVVALAALLPAEDGQRQDLERERERLTNLLQLHLYTNRLAQVLEAVSEPDEAQGSARRAAEDAENLWELLREYRRKFSADDRAAIRIENQGREVLRDIGERTGSEALKKLADEP